MAQHSVIMYASPLSFFAAQNIVNEGANGAMTLPSYGLTTSLRPGTAPGMAASARKPIRPSIARRPLLTVAEGERIEHTQRQISAKVEGSPTAVSRSNAREWLTLNDQPALLLDIEAFL